MLSPTGIGSQESALCRGRHSTVWILEAQHFVNLEGQIQMSRQAEARNPQGKNRTKPTRIGHRLVAISDFPLTNPEAVAAKKKEANQPESVTKWSLVRSSLPTGIHCQDAVLTL